MNMTLRVIIDILLGLGAFFTFVGVMGVVRMPDVFGRLQASTCIGSLGNIFLALGGIVYAIGTNAAEAGTYGSADQPGFQPFHVQGGLQLGRTAFQQDGNK